MSAMVVKDPLMSVDTERTDVASSKIFATKSRFWISTFLWLLVVLSMLLVQLDYADWITISDHMGNRLSGSVFLYIVFAWFLPLAMAIIMVTVDEARVQLGKNKEALI